MSDLTSMLKICVGRDYFLTLYPVFLWLRNLQKITCIIFFVLFGLSLFSHQSCTSSTLLLPKEIYTRK